MKKNAAPTAERIELAKKRLLRLLTPGPDGTPRIFGIRIKSSPRSYASEWKILVSYENEIVDISIDVAVASRRNCNLLDGLVKIKGGDLGDIASSLSLALFGSHNLVQWMVQWKTL